MSTSAAHTCDHCDSSTPHSHEDPLTYTRSYLATTKKLIVVRTGLAAAAFIALIAISWQTNTSIMAFAAGVLGWLVVLIAGLLSLNAQPTAGTKAFLISTIVAAAITPVAAFGIALWRPGTSGASAWVTVATASLGWFLAALITDVLRARQLRIMLTANDRDGEVARDALTKMPNTQASELMWSIATPALVAGYIWLCIALPLVVIMLIPLHVVISLWSRRSTMGR